MPYDRRFLYFGKQKENFMKKTEITTAGETITVAEFAKALELEVVYEGRGSITLSSISVSRPGLQL